MPLLIEHRDGPPAAICCPIIVCDWCGEQITDAEDGNYEWDCTDHSERRFPVVYTHKACCHPFEQAHKETADGTFRLWYATPLTALPHYLLENLELSAKKSKQDALRNARY